MSTVTLEKTGTGDHDYFLEAVDVTGTNVVEGRINPAINTKELTGLYASRMQLPTNVPWMLRSDRTGAFLDEDASIGDQVETGSRVVMTPKTHLGSGNDR